ncbi:response regulator receiver domain [Yoonia vestfoldensis]|uniref:response regulator receiver domain n=1 Tax=Yoonia vestfoldensis TaxID=245188 RepID=UPI000363B56C|nr:response regulator receiver domain [Yoonia vestfoldensis]
MNFADDQYKAASSFAYTMIVVDDEPVDDPAEPGPALEVKTPGRRDAAAAKKVDQKTEAQRSHPLDAKGLIKSALDLGLVCSVVNPSGDEGSVAKSVAKASLRADIVSLDWHMNHGDDGELASEIIQEILCGDEAIGGRLRLIAIYTGNKDQNGILEKIAERINAAKDISDTVIKDGKVLVNSTGLRLVWLEKSLGNKKLASAVSEKQLPKQLLKSFADLSNGLLSNVALATISAMRDSTHHVLSKFSSDLDGPFFHHRALLENSSDSMDYAVSIVMSAMKSEVNKSQIAEQYTTINAIKRRLEAAGTDSLILRYIKEGAEKQFHFSLDDILTIIESKEDKWPADILTSAKERKENNSNAKPPHPSFKSDFSTVFSESRDDASQSMMRFSFLSSSNSSELSKVSRSVLPKLGLGSVLHSEKSGYLLCLQASCDAARGDGLFFFVPLDISKSSPHVVVPHLNSKGEPNYIGLAVPPNCYTKSLTINFGDIDPADGGVTVNFDVSKNIFHVLCSEKNEYRWLANLKYKRALRISQDVSQQMSRIGFDEFEPFREKRS